MASLRRTVKGHPWVKEVTVLRELPHTIHLQIIEHRARGLLLMDHLYLVNSEGLVFKRADLDEQEGLVVITGIDRPSFLEQPRVAQKKLRRALQLVDRYYSQNRPQLSEIHMESGETFTLYLKRGGVAVRVGRELTDERLLKFDTVWAGLGPEAERARILFLDHETHPDRVMVRMGRYQ
jgi:cell division septal protein FtsQ